MKSSFNEKICISLNFNHLEIWIIIWFDKSVTQFISSSILEFGQLKISKIPDNHRGEKTASTISESNQIIISIMNIIINLNKFILKTKNNSVKSRVANSIPVNRYISSIMKYSSNQWIDDELMNFLNHYAIKYNDQEYNKYWCLLIKERLSIDLYKITIVDSAKAMILAHNLSDFMDVSAGTIQRWLSDFKKWYETIKDKRIVHIEK